MSDNDRISCAKCGAAMESGFILDTGLGHSSASTWVEGELGDRPWVTKLDGHERYGVTTYRCPSCGYLESYALAPK